MTATAKVVDLTAEFERVWKMAKCSSPGFLWAAAGFSNPPIEQCIRSDVLVALCEAAIRTTPDARAGGDAGMSEKYRIAGAAVCVARNKWAEELEELWLETDENHPDDFIGRAVVDAIEASERARPLSGDVAK